MAQKRRISKDYLVGLLVASTNRKKQSLIKDIKIMRYYTPNFNSAKTLHNGF